MSALTDDAIRNMGREAWQAGDTDRWELCMEAIDPKLGGDARTALQTELDADARENPLSHAILEALPEVESIGPAHQQQLDVMQAALDRINAAVPESFDGDAADYIEHMHELVVTLEGRIEVDADRRAGTLLEHTLANTPRPKDVQACGPSMMAESVQAPAGPPLRRLGSQQTGEPAGAGQLETVERGPSVFAKVEETLEGERWNPSGGDQCPRTGEECPHSCADPETCAHDELGEMLR